MKTRLGPYETLLLAYTQMRKARTVRIGEVRELLRLSAKQERELLSRMARTGLIARVRRGLYLVPPSLPLGGAWGPSEAEALNALMEDRQGSYQVCGLNAFNRYRFSEQIPNRVYAYNNRISGERTIGKVPLVLFKVADKRLGSTEQSVTSEGPGLIYPSRVRTLVDAVYDWARFNSLPRGYAWIRQELAARRVSASELVRDTLRYGDMGAIRRMGALLEREGVAQPLLRKLERALTPTSAWIPWIPDRPKRGAGSRRWGVVINGAIEESEFRIDEDADQG